MVSAWLSVITEVRKTKTNGSRKKRPTAIASEWTATQLSSARRRATRSAAVTGPRATPRPVRFPGASEGRVELRVMIVSSLGR